MSLASPEGLKMQTEIYVEDQRLIRLADKIADLEPCPFAGRVTRDQVLMALGEFGDFWPESILSSVG